jgi:hypothetical protein
VEEALACIRLSADAGDQINLVLFDIDLNPVSGDKTTQASTDGDIEAALDVLIGLELDAAIHRAMRAAAPVVQDFRYMPLIAFVSPLALRLITRAREAGLVAADGSIGGCDCLVQKPLDIDSARVLLEICDV